MCVKRTCVLWKDGFRACGISECGNVSVRRSYVYVFAVMCISHICSCTDRLWPCARSRRERRRRACNSIFSSRHVCLCLRAFVLLTDTSRCAGLWNYDNPPSHTHLRTSERRGPARARFTHVTVPGSGARSRKPNKIRADVPLPFFHMATP